MKPEALDELLTRVEALTEPDRAVDLALATALVPDVLVLRQRNDDSGADPYTHWRYTEKVDDALALIERRLHPLHPGMMIKLDGRYSGPDRYWFAEITWPSSERQGRGRSPALALLVALLRAELSP
jgi:hypothetical protein